MKLIWIIFCKVYLEMIDSNTGETNCYLDLPLYDSKIQIVNSQRNDDYLYKNEEWKCYSHTEYYYNIVFIFKC